MDKKMKMRRYEDDLKRYEDDLKKSSFFWLKKNLSPQPKCNQSASKSNALRIHTSGTLVFGLR